MPRADEQPDGDDRSRFDSGEEPQPADDEQVRESREHAERVDVDAAAPPDGPDD